MKHFLLYLFILILVAPAWGQKMTGQATAPKVSGTTTSTKPCITCTMSSQGGAPPISFGKIRNPLSPQTASGAILVDDGDPSVLSQDGSWVFSGKNLDNDGNQHPMYFDFQGIYGNLSGFWPTTLQARYDFTQGAVISLYPSEQHSDPTYPGHPLEVTHPDVSGSIIMTSTRNDNIGDRFFGPSLILQQYVDNGHPESDKYWPSLLYISKRGDVILGDKRFHSNNRGSDIDASGHYVDRKSGSNSYYSGTKLFFSGDESMSEEVWDNACPLFMQRYNRELYNSELRVNIGYASGHYMDDSRQRVVFGAYDQDEGSWQENAAIYNNGQVFAREVVVTTKSFPDYVFSPTYHLAPLQEVEQKIKELGHLPGMPAAAEVEKNGLKLGEQNRLLVEKVEELTLHLIRMQKELDALKAEKK